MNAICFLFQLAQTVSMCPFNASKQYALVERVYRTRLLIGGGSNKKEILGLQILQTSKLPF